MNSNRRIILSIFWVILGAALIVLSKTELIDSEMYIGMGGGLIIVGILQIVNKIRYNKDAEYKKNVDISISDERNKTLRLTAWAYAGYSFVIVAGIAIISFTVMKLQTYANILSYCLCFILVVYWISYLILQKKR